MLPGDDKNECEIIPMPQKLFDPKSEIGQQYVQYLINRNRIWADKYIRKIPQRYDGDEILENYHFCNIWRETDRFSVEEIKRMKGLSLRDQIILISIARLTLSWSTTDLLMDGATLDDIYDHWEYCKNSDATFVSNAISFYPRAGSDRAKDIIDHRDDVFRYAGELEESINKAQNGFYLFSKINLLYKHIGAFRAYEIFTSLTYSKHFQFTEHEACLVGPGAIGGLTYVTGQTVKPVHCDAIQYDLQEQVKEHLISLGDEFTWIPKKLQGNARGKEEHKFTVRTLEDSLCEFRKYWNIKTGKGRRRKYYQGLLT